MTPSDITPDPAPLAYRRRSDGAGASLAGTGHHWFIIVIANGVSRGYAKDDFWRLYIHRDIFDAVRNGR